MEGNQFTVIILIGILLYLVLVISAIYHNSVSSKSTPKKLIWYAIIIFAPFIGSIMYWVLGRR